MFILQVVSLFVFFISPIKGVCFDMAWVFFQPFCCHLFFLLIKTRIRESSLQGYANRFSKGAVSSDGTGWVRFE